MGVTINDRVYDISLKKGVALTAATISFETATKKIKDSGDGLAIFETGEILVVSGSALNDGYYTIATGGVAAEIVVSEALVEEAAGASVTLTATVYGMMTVVQATEFRRRANDFAPVIGVPGAQLEYAEDVWRPWVLGDFRGSLGQENWDDPTRPYEMTPGLRIFKDRITLDTQFHDEDDAIIVTKGVDFKGNHYAIDQTGSHKNVRKRVPAGTWSTVYTASHTIRDIYVFGDYIYIGTGGGGMFYSQDGSSWSATAKDPSQNVHNLLMYRQYLWAGIQWKLWFNPHPRAAEWKPEQGIIVGDGDSDLVTLYEINGLAILGGIIAIGRSNGIYIYEGSGNRAEGPIIDFENKIWSGNCGVFFVTDGFLYYNVGDRIKRTDLRGSEFDVTPSMTGSTAKEIYGFGHPVGGQGYQGHAYIGFDDMEGLYPVVLEMPTIDVGGWRMVYKGASGDSMRGAWFSAVAQRLVINDGATRTQRFTIATDTAYPDYVQTASVTTPWFDAGDVWSQKIFAAMLAYARDLSATETIALYYEKDYSGSLVLINTFTSGRENETVFDPTRIAISARKLRLQIVLSRDAADSTVTPVLILPLVATYMVRPKPTYAQQVIVRLHDNIQTHDGKPTEHSAATLKAFVRACEAYDFPIEYTDRDGDTWDVFVSRTEELRQFKFTDQAGNRRQEDVMVITMREV